METAFHFGLYHVIILISLWLFYRSGAVESDESYNNRHRQIPSVAIRSKELVECSEFSRAFVDPEIQLDTEKSMSDSLREIGGNMTSQGGVVFFLHIPKTGGTTLRFNLESYDRIQYIFAKNFSTYWDTAPLVENSILHGTQNQSILFYEIHATTSPSFFRLRNKLRRWKTTAQRHGVPTFFFTLIRDPTDYAFSHFNFFHVQPRNPTFEQCNATQEDFVRLTLHNPQCQFLFQGEASMRSQKVTNKMVQKEDCDAVQDSMIELLDWIGVTDRMNSETLPLLHNLLDLPLDHMWTNQKVSKYEQDYYFGRENVSKAVLDWLNDDMSFLDFGLYNMAANRYRYNSISLIPSNPQNECQKLQ